MYPKTVQDLCGWNIRSLACGSVNTPTVCYWRMVQEYRTDVASGLDQDHLSSVERLNEGDE